MLKLILGVYMGLTRAYLIGCYMHIRKHRQNKKGMVKIKYPIWVLTNKNVGFIIPVKGKPIRG